VLELDAGIRRVTFALPLGIDHVHCYLLPASAAGGSSLTRGSGSRTRGTLGAGTRRTSDTVERIVITTSTRTVGAAADLAL
jgi:hypothetical protein